MTMGLNVKLMSTLELPSRLSTSPCAIQNNSEATWEWFLDIEFELFLVNSMKPLVATVGFGTSTA